jgi:malonyl CoA-acyl carrier protein transacylase
MARLVVVAPGRGSYNRTELGYFKRFADHPAYGARRELLERADALRSGKSRITLSELDEAQAYQSSVHLPGENASALIFTASAADYRTISEEHEVCAVLGNSMGWYTTLFTGGALDFDHAFQIVDTMGYFQKGNVVGGQIIYPIIDENWRVQPGREAAILEQCVSVSQSTGEPVGLSIRLGGFLVIAGSNKGLSALTKELEPIKMGRNEYPFKLARHAAFHTSLMQAASEHGHEQTKSVKWQQPTVPMIDGRGALWRPYTSDPADLLQYTLTTQVVEAYDFTASVRFALREYNPDHVVLLGPGDTLGGSIAHVMIAEGWRGMHSKDDFMAAQKQDRPPLIAMNRLEQAELVI